MDRPLLIVISSNRNYGWVVPAFLKANTQWADYIVITDQMSTDGSREMYAKYNEECNVYGVKCKIIVVDDKDMEFKENTRARVAFEKGREIAAGRDAIYFALDIDEVLPAKWMETEDGKKILNSKPGDMFGLKWANLQPDNKTYIEEPSWQYKIFHDNGVAWQKSKDELHAPHLPYSSWEIEPYQITDFPNLHFGHYHKRWRKFNAKYYGMLDVHQHRSKSVIPMNRGYNYPDPIALAYPRKEIKKEWLYKEFNIFGLVDLNAQPQGLKLIKELIVQDGIEKFQSVDIWDEDLCNELQVKDPRTMGWKILHWYLRKTQPYRNTLVIRGVDKILKQFV